MKKIIPKFLSSCEHDSRGSKHETPDDVGNWVCERFTMDGVVCPPKMRRGFVQYKKWTLLTIIQALLFIS